MKLRTVLRWIGFVVLLLWVALPLAWFLWGSR